MTSLPAEPELSLAKIDQPDFAEALAADEDGSFAAEVNRYLDLSQSKIKRAQDAGLSKEEFEAVSRLAESIQTARRFFASFVKLRQLPPAV